MTTEQFTHEQLQEMSRLEFRDGLPYAGVEAGWDTDLVAPYPYVAPGPFRLSIRLASTRAGNNARWVAGDEARKALNNAPYRPVLRAVVQDFAWTPAATRDTEGHWLPGPKRPAPDQVVQFGTAVPNWRARIVMPLPDPMRAGLTRVRERYVNANREPDLRQGALSIWRYCDPWSEFGQVELPCAGSGNRWLYNHLLTPCRQFVYRVLSTPDGPQAWAVATPTSWDTYIRILSPDHPDEPVSIMGLIALMHPLPVAQVD